MEKIGGMLECMQVRYLEGGIRDHFDFLSRRHHQVFLIGIVFAHHHVADGRRIDIEKSSLQHVGSLAPFYAVDNGIHGLVDRLVELLLLQVDIVQNPVNL